VLRLIGWAWVTIDINVVTHTKRKYNFLIVHLSFEETIRLFFDHWLIKRKLGCKQYLPVMNLGGGAVSKVEALYYANVTIVAYK
jgi:hypothetical protein